MRLDYLIPLLSLCALCGCGGQQTSRHERGVMLVRPVEMPAEQVRSLPGVVKEAKSVSVAFKTPGQISRLLVKEGDFVRQGQLVALLDDSATVKRFYKKDGYFVLHPENPTMDDIVVDEVVILGKVIGLVRSF